MIHAVHAVIHTTAPKDVRAFFRDVLELRWVDAGGGWLIFALPPAELGVHPTDSTAENGRHVLYLMCDDIEATMAELKTKGVEFSTAVTQQRWGYLTSMKIPGGSEIGLYQPTHPSPLPRAQSSA